MRMVKLYIAIALSRGPNRQDSGNPKAGRMGRILALAFPSFIAFPPRPWCDFRPALRLGKSEFKPHPQFDAPRRLGGNGLTHRSRREDRVYRGDISVVQDIGAARTEGERSWVVLVF
jgi:hypothetical protein